MTRHFPTAFDEMKWKMAKGHLHTFCLLDNVLSKWMAMGIRLWKLAKTFSCQRHRLFPGKTKWEKCHPAQLATHHSGHCCNVPLLVLPSVVDWTVHAHFMSQQMFLSRFETTLQVAFHWGGTKSHLEKNSSKQHLLQRVGSTIIRREQTNKKRLKLSIAEVTLREFKTPVHAVTDLVTWLTDHLLLLLLTLVCRRGKAKQA